MSKKIENWLKKYVIDEKWWINISCGLIAAVLMPELLPLQIENLVRIDPRYIHLFNQFAWGIAFLIGAEFVKVVVNVPKQIRSSLDEHKEEIVKAGLKGFSSLLSGEISNSFKDIENLMRNATNSDLKGILLDFIVSTLARIGKNGFVMVDAKVSDYVKYIAESVKKAEKVIMTCVVRPYWFVTDSIQDISLPPYVREQNEYGKGEHLQLFTQKGKEAWAQRWLIIDEHMLAEIFLTVYIDKYFHDKSPCKICNTKSKCPFHTRFKENENILSDIPEIYWFKEKVNKERGVDLIYTLIKAENKRMLKELEDRVYINTTPQLDIRFNFTNIQEGILRIRWGDFKLLPDGSFTGAEPLAWIQEENLSDPVDRGKQYMIDPRTGVRSNKPPRHKFYKSFVDILRRIENLADRKKVKEEMKKHLFQLQGEVVQISESDDSIIATEIKFIVASLQEKIDNNLENFYDELLNFYQTNGISEEAFVVLYDPLHRGFPIRKASWKSNWEGILNAKKQ